MCVRRAWLIDSGTDRKWDRFRQAFWKERKHLFWLLITYIPAVFLAGYLGHAFLNSYVFAFIVGGMYMLALMFIWGRILMMTR